MLSPSQITQFNEQGFLVLPNAVKKAELEEIRDKSLELVNQAQAPIEYEADLEYPGAPKSKEEPGGETTRRFLQLYDRDPAFFSWLTSANISVALKQLLGEAVFLAKAHHNCLMTKNPEYSSDSNWHQDIRYWSFTQRELITTWLALGDESRDNGCLQVIPGSHKLALSSDSFDELQFFKSDYTKNQALIQQAKAVELSAGDVLLFHCRLLHAATRNFSAQAKYSVVFTFHCENDKPLPDSRSAKMGSVLIS